jgi:hypothetical protein
VRAAALEGVGSQVVDAWLEEGRPKVPGNRRVSPHVEFNEVQITEERYRSLLPKLAELSAAKQAERRCTGARQWRESRELVSVASFLKVRLGPDDCFADANVVDESVAKVTERFVAAIAGAQSAFDARKDLAELRVRQELQQAFKSTSPNADVAEAKRIQMELEALEMRGLVCCGGFAKAMATVAANVMATCVAANPWNKDAPTDGKEGERYAARCTDLLSWETPPHVLKAEAALQEALCEAGPSYAFKEISRRAKKHKIAATAALSLLDELEKLNPQNVPDALAAAAFEANEQAEKAQRGLIAAQQPKSEWKHAKSKLVGARVVHNQEMQAGTGKTQGWAADLHRHAKVEKKMHEDKIAGNVKEQLNWARAKHRLYRAYGEWELLNDIGSSTLLHSQVEEDIPTGQHWIAICNRMRAVLTNQVADAQTRLDGTMDLRIRYAAGRSKVAETEWNLRTKAAVAKGCATPQATALAAAPVRGVDSVSAIAQSVHAASSVENATQEVSGLAMLQERALCTDTLYSKIAALACWQGRIKSDKIVKLRREAAFVAKQNAHMGMISNISPEVGRHGDVLPWGVSVVIPALERSEAAVQELRDYEDLLLQRMRAAAGWRKHKGIFLGVSRHVGILGDECQHADDKAQHVEASKMARAAEELAEIAMAFVDLADARGIVQAVKLSEIVFLRMSCATQVGRADLLLKVKPPVREILTQMAAQDFRRLELATKFASDIQKEYKDSRQQLTIAAGTTVASFLYGAKRATQLGLASKEALAVRKLVADTALQVERKAWDPPAVAAAIINHGTVCRRLLLLDAAIDASNEVMLITQTAIKNRDFEVELVGRSAKLADKTRETIEMPDSPLKEEAADALRQEAAAIAEAMSNRKKPSTAQEVVEELKEKQYGVESRRSKSDAQLAQLERKAASLQMQLILLKSEERRCRAAAKAFPELVEELLKDREVGGLATKRLNSSVAGRVCDGFEQSAEEVQKAVEKVEAHLGRLQDTIKGSLASEVCRQEITSHRALSEYFVDHARPAEERTAIGLANGLPTRVPRGSRLRLYHEYP